MMLLRILEDVITFLTIGISHKNVVKNILVLLTRYKNYYGQL
jgi:hypothetical protein